MRPSKTGVVKQKPSLCTSFETKKLLFFECEIKVKIKTSKHRDNPNLDGPAIRNANQGDSRESIRRKNPISITWERFARIASNLRFAIFSPPPPEARFAKKGFSSGPWNDSRESSDAHESANRFARIGPSKNPNNIWNKKQHKQIHHATIASTTTKHNKKKNNHRMCFKTNQRRKQPPQEHQQSQAPNSRMIATTTST